MCIDISAYANAPCCAYYNENVSGHLQLNSSTKNKFEEITITTEKSYIRELPAQNSLVCKVRMLQHTVLFVSREDSET